jgi:hypothetical protein
MHKRLLHGRKQSKRERGLREFRDEQRALFGRQGEKMTNIDSSRQRSRERDK